MRTALLTGVALVAVAIYANTAAASDCASKDKQAKLSEVSVEQLASLIGKKKVTVIDASGTDTRTEYGVIPGASLLTSSREYAMSELPKDRDANLVFYCGGPMCSAAPKAAKRAVGAGYTQVSVLEAGIKGWVEAGQPVSKPQA